MIVSFVERDLRIDGVSHPQKHPIVDAVALSDLVIVLFDPDGMGQPWQSGSRNLVAIDRRGQSVWVADVPDPTGYYYRISSTDPLTVLFWSYDVTLDWRTGEIVEAVFTK